MSDIFISYASQDRPKAQVLAEALVQHGWSVWWDRTIPSGKRFDQVIQEALADARCVLVLWSKQSVTSDWVLEEAEEGRKRHILVPVFIEDVPPTMGFRRIQAADFIGWDGEEISPAFQKLVADIAAILGPPAKAEMEQVAVGETEEVATAVLEREEESAVLREPVAPEVEAPPLDPPRPEQMEQVAVVEPAEGGPQVVEQEAEPTPAPPEKKPPVEPPPPPPPWPKLLPWLIGAALLASVFVAFWVFQEPDRAPVMTPPLPTKTTSPKDLVVVPSGEFWMGCNEKVDRTCDSDEKPGGKVNVGAFSIDTHEVTVADYRKCVEAGKCSTEGLTGFLGLGNCNWDESGRDNHPINCVDWNHAKTYCAWTGKRLPTEAEWEKAARGADRRIYPWGNEWDPSKANVGFGRGTVDVDSYPSGKSPYGAYHLVGNVWEWTSSLYKDYPYEAGDGREDPKAEGSRVLRGGSWGVTVDGARSSVRVRGGPGGRFDLFGFRCAKTP